MSTSTYVCIISDILGGTVESGSRTYVQRLTAAASLFCMQRCRVRVRQRGKRPSDVQQTAGTSRNPEQRKTIDAREKKEKSNVRETRPGGHHNLGCSGHHGIYLFRLFPHFIGRSWGLIVRKFASGHNSWLFHPVCSQTVRPLGAHLHPLSGYLGCSTSAGRGKLLRSTKQQLVGGSSGRRLQASRGKSFNALEIPMLSELFVRCA